MDTLPPSFTDEVNTLQLSLVDSIQREVESGKLSYEESQTMARYILSETARVTDDASLILFLQKLAQKWVLFSNIAGMEKVKRENTAHDASKVTEIQDQLSKLT